MNHPKNLKRLALSLVGVLQMFRFRMLVVNHQEMIRFKLAIQVKLRILDASIAIANVEVAWVIDACQVNFL